MGFESFVGSSWLLLFGFFGFFAFSPLPLFVLKREMFHFASRLFHFKRETDYCQPVCSNWHLEEQTDRKCNRLLSKNIAYYVMSDSEAWDVEFTLLQKKAANLHTNLHTCFPHPHPFPHIDFKCSYACLVALRIMPWGEILASLKSTAKLPLTSLGPEFNRRCLNSGT